MHAAGGRTETVKINMHIDTVDGFSGHADRMQLMEYKENETAPLSMSLPSTVTTRTVWTLPVRFTVNSR